MFIRQELDAVIKAYDIRGLVDEQITPEFAFVLGTAFARFLSEEREPGTVVIGEDMRPSSDLLATAFADGVSSQGMDAIRIGIYRHVVFRIGLPKSAGRDVYRKP